MPQCRSLMGLIQMGLLQALSLPLVELHLAVHPHLLEVLTPILGLAQALNLHPIYPLGIQLIPRQVFCKGMLDQLGPQHPQPVVPRIQLVLVEMVGQLGLARSGILEVVSLDYQVLRLPVVYLLQVQVVWMLAVLLLLLLILMELIRGPLVLMDSPRL